MSQHTSTGRKWERTSTNRAYLHEKHTPIFPFSFLHVLLSCSITNERMLRDRGLTLFCTLGFTLTLGLTVRHFQRVEGFRGSVVSHVQSSSSTTKRRLCCTCAKLTQRVLHLLSLLCVMIWDELRQTVISELIKSSRATANIIIKIVRYTVLMIRLLEIQPRFMHLLLVS